MFAKPEMPVSMSIPISRGERLTLDTVRVTAVMRNSVVWMLRMMRITVLLVILANMPYDSMPFKGYATEAARLEGAIKWVVAKCGVGLYF